MPMQAGHLSFRLAWVMVVFSLLSLGRLEPFHYWQGHRNDPPHCIVGIGKGYMKLKCLHFGLAVGFIGVLLYGAQPQSADAAEPSRLTDSQLDAVTAGTLVLSVEATAIAIGQDTYTSTDSLTRVYSRGVVDMGWCEGSALAVASGAETFTYADVRIGAWADGDIVIMRGDSTTLMGTNLAYETADLFVVSVNSPGLAKR